MSTRLKRFAGVLGAAPLLLAAQAGAARASSRTGSEVAQAGTAPASGGSAPSALSWIPIEDSRGISIWKYEMSLDRGGVTSPGKVIWSFLIDLFWQVYRAVVAVAIWIIDWVLSFAWLHTIAGPLLALSGGLADLVDDLGLAPVLLTIMAVCAVLWMAKGKWAVGIFELFMSLLIASVAIGVLSDPVGLVAGPDGLLIQSRDLGLEVADGLANDGGSSGSAEELRANVTMMLTDAFVRQPAQLLNFGTLIDGGPCEPFYDAVVAAGPYGTEPDIRNVVALCDPALGEAAANPNAGMATSAVVLAPAALIVLTFAILLAGVVLLAGMYALYQSVKAIVTLVVGLLPGRARGSLWRTIADLVIALVTVVFSIVFLTAYLLLIQGVFESAEPGDGVMKTFISVDIMLVVGLVVFWRGRKALHHASERLAQALATRPGAGPTALPAREGFNPATAYYKAKMGVAAVSSTRSAAAAVGDRAGAGRDAVYRGVGRAGQAAAGAAADTWSRFGLASAVAAANSRTGTGAPGPWEAPPSTAVTRVHERVQRTRPASGTGRIARIGAATAAAAVTGGTAAVGVSATRHAVTGTAKRAAVTGRLTRALPPGRPTGPSKTPPGSPSPTPSRTGYDRVVRDGQVLLVPRTSEPVPSAAQETTRSGPDRRGNRAPAGQSRPVAASNTPSTTPAPAPARAPAPAPAKRRSAPPRSGSGSDPSSSKPAPARAGSSAVPAPRAGTQLAPPPAPAPARQAAKAPADPVPEPPGAARNRPADRTPGVAPADRLQRQLEARRQRPPAGRAAGPRRPASGGE